MPSFQVSERFGNVLPGSSELHVSNLVMRSSQADGINLHGKVSHATVSKVPDAQPDVMKYDRTARS